MTPAIIRELERLYANKPAGQLERDIAEFDSSGYVVDCNGCFMLLRVVHRGWLVYCAVCSGGWKQAVEHMPFWLPFVGWAREAKGRTKVKWYLTDRVLHHAIQ